jgi:hypothetical protein
MMTAKHVDNCLFWGEKEVENSTNIEAQSFFAELHRNTRFLSTVFQHLHLKCSSITTFGDGGCGSIFFLHHFNHIKIKKTLLNKKIIFFIKRWL